ncbi:MAG: right-handed parallel beta-helix repeat-containing protein, partial [Planctomycetota bacterium]
MNKSIRHWALGIRHLLDAIRSMFGVYPAFRYICGALLFLWLSTPALTQTPPYNTWTQSTQPEFQTAGYSANNVSINTADGNGSLTIPVASSNSASYTALQSMPSLGSYAGSSAIINGGGGGKALCATSTHIYAFFGDGNTAFSRYEIASGNWETRNVTPWAQSYGASMAWDGADSIYAVGGGNTTNFARYSIAGNNWTGLAAVPFAVVNGGQTLARVGSRIYCIQGGQWAGTTTYGGFEAYDTSTSSWTTGLTDQAMGQGASIAWGGSGVGTDYIYLSYGHGGSGGWCYRYSISGNSWAGMASPITTAPYDGSSMCLDTINNRIYLVHGNNSATFTYGQVNGDGSVTWNNRTGLPRQVGCPYGWSSRGSGGLAYPGSGNYIYCLNGTSSTNNVAYDGSNYYANAHFYRFDMTANSWSTLTPISLNVATYSGSSATWDRGDSIYVLRGNLSQDFFRYSIRNATWERLAYTPEAVYNGADLAYAGDTPGADYVYCIRGWQTNNFWRYRISTNTWEWVTPQPGGNTGETTWRNYGGGSLCYARTPSGDQRLYVLQGYNGGGFWYYSLGSGTWTYPNNFPEGNMSQSSLVWSGPGGANSQYLWATCRNDPAGWNAVYANLYRYDMSAGTWSAPLAQSSNAYNASWYYGWLVNSHLAWTGGNYIYRLGGCMYDNNSGAWAYTNWLERYSISGNSWSTLTVTPVTQGFGSWMVYGGDNNIFGMLANSGTDLYQVKVSTDQVNNGIYTSATLDMGSLCNLRQLEFTGVVPVACGPNALRFQIATNNDNATWNYIGPDGTNTTYYTISGSDISSQHYGKRYLRYRLYLGTVDVNTVPRCDSVTVTYYPGAASGYTSISTSTWDDPSAWSPAGIPGPGDNVTINSNMSIRRAAYCGDLTVNSGFTLTFDNVDNGARLTVSNGAVIRNNGTVTIANATTNAAVIESPEGGLATFSGNALNLSALTGQNINLGNIIYEPVFTTYQNTVGIIGVVRVGAATVSTGGRVNIQTDNASLSVRDGNLTISGVLRMGTPGANTRLVIDHGSAMQYGIIIPPEGKLIAQGTSVTNPDCYIETLSDNLPTWILFQGINGGDGSAGFLQFCTLSNIGNRGSGQRGVITQYVDGSIADLTTAENAATTEGFTMDGCRLTNAAFGLALGFSSATTPSTVYPSTGNRVSNNTISGLGGSISEPGYGIEILLNNAVVTHTVTGNTVDNYYSGVRWVNLGSGSAVTFDTNTRVVSNTLYNCTYGMNVRRVCGLIADCAFGPNTTADLWFDQGFSSIIRALNCSFGSTTEVGGINDTTSGYASFLWSQRHDATPGLTRLWGSVDPQYWTGNWVFRYDTQLYPAGTGGVTNASGDANIQKVIEFGGCDISENVNSIPITGTNFYARNAAGIMEMVGTATYPVILRPLGSIWYGFYINGTSGNQPTVTATYYDVSGLYTNGFYIGQFVWMNSVSSGTFRANVSTGRHLNMRLLGTRTISNCSFDSSTTYDVTYAVGAANTLTMSNCSRQRSSDEGVSGSIVWTGGGGAGYTHISIASGLWSATTTWDAGTVPTISSIVAITGTNVVTVDSSIIGSISARSIEIRPTATLTIDTSSWSPLDVVIDNGGFINNSGIINFTISSGGDVRFRRLNVGGAVWTFRGASPNWDNASYIYLGGCDWQTNLATSASTANNITLEDSIETRGFAIQAAGQVFLNPGIRWTARGNVTLSNAYLTFYDGSIFEILSPSPGDYGLTISSGGNFQAIGIAASRVTIRSSAQGAPGYIVLGGNSSNRFDYCDITNFGYAQSGNPATDTRYGICLDGLNGTGVAGAWFTNCNIYNNYVGLFFKNASNNTAADLTEGVITCNIYSNLYAGVMLYGSNNNLIYNCNIYDNINGLALSDGAGATSADIVQNSVFGTPTDNSYDINFVMTPNASSAVILRNCQQNSAVPLYWSQTSPGANSYILHQRYNNTAGLSRIWGGYVFNPAHFPNGLQYSQQTFTGANDVNTQKRIEFVSGGTRTTVPSNLNFGFSRWRIPSGQTLNVTGTSSAPVRFYASGTSRFDFIAENGSGFNANYFEFYNTAYQGVQIQTPAPNFSLQNGSLTTDGSIPSSSLLNISNTAFAGPEVITAVAFDNSTTYDVTVNIAGGVVTMTNCANDYPNTKDQETSGTVEWPVGTIQSATSGDWNTPATWVGNVVPSVADSVLINTGNVVTVTSNGWAGGITVSSNAGLVLSGATLRIRQNDGFIINNGGITVTANSTLNSALAGELFRFTGADIVKNANLTMGGMDYRTAMTVPNGVTLTFNDSMSTTAVAVNGGGTLLHQTAEREWQVSGDVAVNGTVRLGANTTTSIFCPTSAGQFGITVEPTGYFEMLGTSVSSPDCVLRANPNIDLNYYNPYLYIKDGAEALIRNATIRRLGTGTLVNRWGVYGENLDYNPGTEGLTIENSLIERCFAAISLSNSTGNRITGNTLSNNTGGIYLSGSATSNNDISNNFVSSIGAGNTTASLYLLNVNNQTFTGNSFSGSNGYYGIYANNSTNNIIVDTNSNYIGLSGPVNLVCRNCNLKAFGAVTSEVDSSSVGANSSIVSYRHDNSLGDIYVWGDWVLPAGVTRFNYADESYPSAGNTDTRKLVFLRGCAAGFNNGYSRITVPASATMEAIGGGATNLTTWFQPETGRYWNLVVQGTLNINWAQFNNMSWNTQPNAFDVQPGAFVASLNNCTFINSNASAGLSQIRIRNGQTLTMDGCRFTSTNPKIDVRADWDGANPTIVRLTNYSRVSGTTQFGGTRDDELNGSQVLWAANIGLTNWQNLVPATIYQGDSNVPMASFNLGPQSPNVNAPEGIVNRMVVRRLGTGLDNDISAVKVYRDNGDSVFNPTADTLISSGVVTPSSNVADVTLTNPQVITGNLFYVAMDISPLATVGNEVGAGLDNNTSVGVILPHSVIITGFPFATTTTAISTAPYRVDAQVRVSTDASYLGDNVYNTTAENQTRSRNIADLATITYHIRIQNDSTTNSDRFTVTGTGASANWVVSYYDAATGGNEITALITGSGYGPGSSPAFPLLTTGASTTIRAEVTANSAGVGAQQIINIRCFSDTATTDWVRARTTVYANQPDNMVSLSAGLQDSLWTGYDVYSPANQQISGTVNAGSWVTYYIRVQNDGPSTDSFSVTATPAPANWIVSYYNDSTDITSDITSGGYTSGVTNLTAEQVVNLRVEINPAITVAGSSVINLYCWTGSLTDPSRTDENRLTTTVNLSYRPDSNIRTAAGSFNPGYDGLYEGPSSTSQSSAGGAEVGQVISYYVRLVNGGSGTEAFRFTGTASGSGTGGSSWTVTYYYNPNNLSDPDSNLTQIPNNQITGSGWVSPAVTPTGNLVIRMDVRPTSGNIGDTFSAYLTGYSTGNSALVDMVRADCSIGAMVRADALISQSAGSGYIGDGPTVAYEYPVPSASQILTRYPAINQTVTYYIRVQNDGNADDNYTVTGTAGVGGDWTVSYYDAASGGNEISSSVTGAGWVRPAALSATLYYTIRVEITPIGSGLTPGTTRDHIIAVRSVGDQTRRDTVNARAVIRSYQPNNLIRVPSGSYVGTDINDNGSGNNNQAQNVDSNSSVPTYYTVIRPVTYYIQIRNDGNDANSFTVTGTASGGGWTITYYTITNTNITSQVVGAGYTISNLSSGISREIYALIAPTLGLDADNVITAYVRARSTVSGQENVSDTVRAVTTVNRHYFPDLHIKRYQDATGTYTGLNNYTESDAEGWQTVTTPTTIAAGQVVSYHVRVENDGNYNSTYTLTGTAGTGGWTVSYYDNLDNDRTVTFTGTGWVTPSIITSTPITITVRITHDGTPAPGVTVNHYIRARSADLSSERDTVRTATIPLITYQADNWVKRFSDPEGGYIGNGITNTDGTNQTITNTVNNNATVSYHVRIQNDGNVNETISITGTGGGNGWTVTYYNAPSGGTDITAQVLSGVYSQTNIAPTVSYTIRIEVSAGDRTVLAGNSVLTATVRAKPVDTSDTAAQDVVLCVTQVNPVYTMDNLVAVTSTYYGNNVYNETGSGQTDVTNTVAALSTVTYSVQIGNDGNMNTPVTVTASASSGGWTVTYYDGPDTASPQIPYSEITGAGWLRASAITPAGLGYITVELTPGAGVLGGASGEYTNLIRIISTLNPTVSDTVRTRSQTNTYYSADAGIRNQGEADIIANYLSMSITSTDGTGQTKNQTAPTGSVVTYYIRLENDSNVNDTFSVTGTAGVPSNWIVTYYDAPSGGNICNGITTTGWTWGPVSPTGYDATVSRTIRAEIYVQTGTQGASYTMIVTIRSQGSGWSALDTVRSDTTCLNYRPDLYDNVSGLDTDNFYADITPPPQTIQQYTDNNTTVTYYIRVKNDGQNDAFSLTASAAVANWTVSYYDDTSTDITLAMRNGTYSRVINQSVSYDYRIEITPDGTVPLSGTLSAYLYAYSVNNFAIYDAVRTYTIVRLYQADNWVKRGNEPDINYIGDNITNTDGTNQTVTRNVNNNALVSYYVRIQNDGNVNETITVSGSGGGGGWTVTYYNVPTGTDITNLVLSGAYSQTGIAPTVSYTIRIDVLAGDNSVLAGNNVLTTTVRAKPLDTAAIASQDVALCVTQVNPDYTIDGLVSTQTDYNSFAGDGTYNQTGVGQTSAVVSIQPLSTVTYLVRIENDGNMSTQVTLTGLPSSGGWTVTYRDGIDVTAPVIPYGDITGQGWLRTGSIAAGGSANICVEISPDATVVGGAPGEYTNYVRVISNLDSTISDTIRTRT